jgi:hypothetical protein
MIQLPTYFGAACPGGTFLGLPKWYEYLPCQTFKVAGSKAPQYIPNFSNINDVWLVAAAIIELLLRIGVLAALAFVIYGGVEYTMSQGDPDKTTRARMTIINALVGLAISVLAATIVSYVAGRF